MFFDGIVFRVLRSVRRRMRFGLLVTATLASGLTGSVVLFSVVHSVALRPLAFPESNQLMWLDVQDARAAGPAGPSLEVARAWASRSTPFQSISAYYVRSSTVTGRDGPRAALVAAVSGTFFATLHAPLRSGRPIRPEDDTQSAEPVAVVSKAYSMRSLDDAHGVLGQYLKIDGISYEIIGVAPESFTFPDPDVVAWIPLGAIGLSQGNTGGAQLTGAIGRFRNDHERADAAAATLERIQHQVAESEGRDEQAANRVVRVMSLREHIVGAAYSSMVIVMAASAFVLAIACANAAGLFEADAVRRDHDLAVRIAMGASQPTIARELLGEAIVYCTLSGLLCLAGARTILPIVAAWGRDLIPRSTELRLDGVDAMAALLLAALSTTAAALGPAWRAGRIDAGLMLRRSHRVSDTTALRRRELLVVTQLSLTVVLLASTGALAETVVRLLGIGSGIRSEHVITAAVDRPLGEWPGNKGPMRAFGRTLVNELEDVPGVTSAAISLDLPGSQFVPTWIRANGGAPGDSIQVNAQVATADYFRTLGIPLLRGRTFEESDGRPSTPTVIVSASVAQRLFASTDVTGRSIIAPADEANGATGTRTYEIVGVAGDVRAANGAANPILELYIPFERVPVPHMTVLVLTRGSIASTEASIRHVVTRLDAAQAISRLGSLDSILAQQSARPLFYLTIIAAFALVAAILAGVGIYAVVVATVRQRRREFGIRVALGATRRAVLLSVVRRGAILTIWGIALGALLAFVSIRLLRGLLVGASPTDPGVLMAVLGCSLAISLLAHIVPVREALAVQPAVAMSEDV